ncbi:MAG TPA: hypothetical protein VD886_19990 [Herpetosiphonaceae bacterium]|nr:hypothetical protein [Herpetosiphonaceae bacterium]
MKHKQPPPVGSPIAFGEQGAPPAGDYYVPPARSDDVPPSDAAALPSQRRHAILALICFMQFPLCYCAFSFDTFALRPSWPRAIQLALLIATFCTPLFILGRKGRAISRRAFWGAVALCGMTLAVLVLRAAG